MFFRWLKRFVPRGLYGRAALILILPVVVIQLVVSVVFIQRHFDRVTEQMTRSIAFPLGYLIDEVSGASGVEVAALVAGSLGADLGFDARFTDGPVPATRLFYDLSGRSVQSVLAELFPQLTGIDLGADLRRVRLSVDTPHGALEIAFPRGRVSAANPHQLLVLMAFAGVLMTGIAYVFLRNQLRPITRLAEAAEAFGRGRVVPYRPRGATEVRAAGAAFLDMRARVERAREQRTLLLSGVSHDLRTPLTRLKLGLSMAAEGAETEAMLSDVAEMERMIDDFLALARGEALGESEPTDPAALAARIVANARRTGREVELVCGPGAAMLVPLRSRAVGRALDNLVQNALRHAGRVRLGVEAGSDWLRFVVEDDGPGIPSDRREEALRPFTRLDPARNRNAGGGAGLGLAIAADVARGHGGTLRLGDSADLGGLRAEIVLPR